jgi:outer membrane protein assembly factor BamB
VGFLETVDWIGCGWTGQPLVVQWDAQTRANMNLYEDKKNKDGLVEAIYAKMDGWVHFIDMEDGSYTRDPLYVGSVFKGSGAIDPRGYPILYLGAGIGRGGGTQRIYAVSLIDGSILYERTGFHELAPRYWFAFDGAPLVDAETDTLIWPGENGVLYTIKLNTAYDKESGTIEVNPNKPVKTRYKDSYSQKGRYVGYEDSVVVVDHWLYVADNAGMFYCVDLNTMELVWAQDTKDDNNSSPVFEWDDEGNGYIYTAPSLHWTKNSSSKGTVSVYKLDASTGEIIWETHFDCTTVTDLSGGVQATPILGREGTPLEGLIIYAIARCPSTYRGKLVALSTETGEIVWEASTGNYAWSSPTAIYSEDGKAYVFVCDIDGDGKLYDGSTGERIATISFGSTVEASPVVFNDMMIIGSRAGRAFGVKIS